MNFLRSSILILSILTGIVSGNGVHADEDIQVNGSYDSEENGNMPEDILDDDSDMQVVVPAAVPDSSDYGQDLYLLQESFDRLELGIDAMVKMQVVSNWFLCILAGASIVSLFMEWFTK